MTPINFYSGTSSQIAHYDGRSISTIQFTDDTATIAVESIQEQDASQKRGRSELSFDEEEREPKQSKRSLPFGAYAHSPVHRAYPSSLDRDPMKAVSGLARASFPLDASSPLYIASNVNDDVHGSRVQKKTDIIASKLCDAASTGDLKTVKKLVLDCEFGIDTLTYESGTLFTMQ